MRAAELLSPANFLSNFCIFRDKLPSVLIKFSMDFCISDYGSYYFLGIGGVSMSALASILLSIGKTVGGYDKVSSVYTEDLALDGVNVEIGSGNLENFQAVVYTDAINDNDALIIQARKLGKKLISRGQLLREVSKLFATTIAVAGCHGKTTCSSMLAHIFDAAKTSFTAHIGGRDIDYANCYVAGYDYFITEACEYKKNFLYLKPQIALILNSDADHLDCYGTAENLKKAYKQYASNSDKVIKLYGDLPEVNAVTFGFDDRADYYAKNIRGKGGKFAFTVYKKQSVLGKVELSVYGKHNVLNALAAVAAASEAGLPFEAITAGLQSFKGVERRFEFIGTVNGATCIADYAHHPNEIKAALKTARQLCDGNLYIVFQPHTYSRTKLLFKQFVKVFGSEKRLLIYKTYAAREYFDDAGCALTLSKALVNSAYADDLQGICDFLMRVGCADVVLFLGAGDIYDIAKQLVDCR